MSPGAGAPSLPLISSTWPWTVLGPRLGSPPAAPQGCPQSPPTLAIDSRGAGCCGVTGDGQRGGRTPEGWQDTWGVAGHLARCARLHPRSPRLCSSRPCRSHQWGSLFQQKLRLRRFLRLLKTIFLLQLFPGLADMLS